MMFNNHIISLENIVTMGALFGLITALLAVFYNLKQLKPSQLSTELFVRTRSWAFIALGLAAVMFSPKWISTVILAYLSFIALREMISITGFRAADRLALLVAYAAVPVQYYLAYNQQLNLFYVFIPIGMFTLIPFILIGNGQTKMIGRSMALIPALLMLTVFMISHIALLLNLPFQVSSAGASGLVLYLFLMTAFNDVFQFTWGKLLGKRKIIPAISPNKTWAGFTGGVLTTAVWSYVFQFLTPFSGQESLFVGGVLGIAGFAGDILISAIKRDLQLKDTGDLIPGHGGIMDRLDSLVLTAPVLYYLWWFLVEKSIVV